MSDCAACDAIDSAVVIHDGELIDVEYILRSQGIYGAQCPDCAERALVALEEEGIA